jgi:hypothetical protein
VSARKRSWDLGGTLIYAIPIKGFCALRGDSRRTARWLLRQHLPSTPIAGSSGNAEATMATGDYLAFLHAGSPLSLIPAALRPKGPVKLSP